MQLSTCKQAQSYTNQALTWRSLCLFTRVALYLRCSFLPLCLKNNHHNHNHHLCCPTWATSSVQFSWELDQNTVTLQEQLWFSLPLTRDTVFVQLVSVWQNVCLHLCMHLHLCTYLSKAHITTLTTLYNNLNLKDNQSKKTKIKMSVCACACTHTCVHTTFPRLTTLTTLYKNLRTNKMCTGDSGYIIYIYIYIFVYQIQWNPFETKWLDPSKLPLPIQKFVSN